MNQESLSFQLKKILNLGSLPHLVLLMAIDGNLKVLDAMDKPLWSTELGSPNSTTPLVAMLEDSGNLVLRDEHSKRILWQSFDNPTDTFLKGMILNENTTLTSWRDQHDPGTGNYKFKERKGQYVILFNEIIQYWGSEDIFSNSDTTGDDAFELVIKNQNLAESPTRLVMNCTGELQFQSWDGKKWSILWQEPRDKCSVSNACGDFGSCNINNQLMCKCLPGFEPRSLDAWNSGDFSTGCTRKSFPDCKNDSFLSLRLMKVGNTETQVPKKTEEECRAQCLSSCTQCQAYAFQNGTLRTRANSTCYIWLENLNNLQEEYAPAGDVIIYVRVAVSYLEETSRSCKPCGTNVIPYPLSTGQHCGDSMYSRFQCNISTGQLNFKAPGSSYRVTRINQDARKFYIENKADEDDCDPRKSRSTILQTNQLWPFSVTNWCVKSTNNISSMPSKRRNEIEIGWEPPPKPPTCNSPADCRSWPHSSCKATKDGIKRS